MFSISSNGNNGNLTAGIIGYVNVEHAGSGTVLDALGFGVDLVALYGTQEGNVTV